MNIKNTQKSIPIVYISDNNYILPTAVSIQSLIENKKAGTKYDIFILNDSILLENINLFEKFNSENLKIQMLRPENADLLLSIKEKKGYISPAVLLKFAIPSVFENYDKILYLDGDTIINGDLSELYATDITDYYAGVVKDLYLEFIQEYKKHNLESYFNAGVILYNLKKIREEGIDEKLNSKEILEFTKKQVFFEQDTYNLVLGRKVKFLHPKFNYISDSWNTYGNRIGANVFEIDTNDADNLAQNAIIYHLASARKPWLYKNGLMRKYWLDYLQKSPFVNSKIGDKMYCYNYKNSLIENMFSIKNHDDKLHKILTIFGMKFWIKRKNVFSSSKNKNPLFSIIVTSYNYEQFIGKTLESIVNQTFKNYEVIIVDDGSKDNSIAVINGFTQKYNNFKLYQHENNVNKGLVESLKLAFSKCNGEYIAFLESDDYWDEEYLQEKYNFIQENPTCALVCNDIQTVGGNKSDLYVENMSNLWRNIKPEKNVFEYLYKYNIIPTLSGVAVKTSILKSCNFDSYIPAWFDYWIYCQIALNYKIGYIDKKLTFWRIHDDSYINNSEEDNENKTLRKFRKKSNQLLLKKYPMRFIVFKFLRVMRKFFSN